MFNRTAIITGASSGIGKATALRLAVKGTRMVLNARNREKLLQVQEEVNRISGNNTCYIVEGNISQEQVTDECIALCREKWNECPGIFVACAGRGLPGTVIDSDMKEWDNLLDTNIKGLLYQMRSIGKAMLEAISAGRDFVAAPLDIVIIGSNIGRNVSPFNSVYGATKFAAHGLTEALRRQLGPKGIRVTLLEPGIVGTNFQRAAGYNQEWFTEYSKEVGPILTPDDVAQVIAFLLDLPGNVNLDNISVRPTRQSYP